MDVRNVHPSMIEGNNRKLSIEDDEKRGALSDTNFQSGVSTGSDLAVKRHFNKGPTSMDEHLRRSKQIYKLFIIRITRFNSNNEKIIISNYNLNIFSLQTSNFH